jgi:CubicO group peptidase (beta-lactamase class C family)
MKKRLGERLIALLLLTVLCMSSMFTNNAVYASQETSKNGNYYGLTTIDSQDELPVKTSGQIEVPKPDKLPEAKKNIDKVKSFSSSDYAETKKVADTIASYLTSAYGETSVQFALIDNGKVVLSGNDGVYSLSSKKELTSDNMYGIASVSKIFTTAAVMNLVEDGKVNLDTPVTTYISDFKMKDERYKQITVRMLLNHSSGLMGSTFHNALLLNDNDTYYHDNLLKELQTQRLKANPGAYSVYCNDGFTLAEILVERVSGMDFTTYVTNTFIKPLTLEDTATPVSSFDTSRLAKTYNAVYKDELPNEYFNSIGTGGFFSSAEDLCVFAQTFMNQSNGILNQDTLRAMENKEYEKGIWPDAIDNALAYGLGWDSVNLYPFNQYNIKALAKGGDSGVYHSNLTVLPEQNMAIAVVSSGGSSQYNQIAAQQILLTALKEKGIINEIKADKIAVAPVKVALPSEMKKYEGIYAAAGAFLQVKMNDDGLLVLTYPQHKEYGSVNLVYTSNGCFVSSDGSASLRFVEESNGETYIRQSSYDTMPYVGQTASDFYIAQKVEINNPSKDVLEAWEKRDGKLYYMVNEKYSSASYLDGAMSLEVAFTEGFEGYIGMNKIVDENTAVSFLNGPGSMSRDLMDYTFYKEGNTEYLKAGAFIFVEGKAVKNLSTKKKFTCSIKENGYAVWYKISDKVKNKTITVKVPKNAAFVVYDNEGTVVNNSYVTKSYTVKLPKNGTICFLGDAKSKFAVNYK